MTHKQLTIAQLIAQAHWRGEISEGCAAQLMGKDRLSLREFMIQQYGEGYRDGPPTAVQYELLYDSDNRRAVCVQRFRQFDGSFLWGIVRSGEFLGKTPVFGVWFLFSDDWNRHLDEWDAEYRWETAEDALEFWNKNRQHIVATTDERQAFGKVVKERKVY